MTETNEELTLEEKEKLADYWVKRLQLDDWDIKFNLNASRNQLGEGTVGEARLNEVTKQAVILVLKRKTSTAGNVRLHSTSSAYWCMSFSTLSYA